MTYNHRNVVADMYVAFMHGGECAALEVFEALRSNGTIDADNVERVMYSYRSRMRRVG